MGNISLTLRLRPEDYRKTRKLQVRLDFYQHTQISWQPKKGHIQWLLGTLIKTASPVNPLSSTRTQGFIVYWHMLIYTAMCRKGTEIMLVK